MKAIKVGFAVIFFLLIGFSRANADLTFTVTDLGTLGGNTSSASGYTAGGVNNAGMIVGSSTTSDNSEHAFLYYSGQIFDLNTMCDLSQSDFKVLSLAKAINDSCLITGEGITTNGDKHAFLLTPSEVAGGQWSYACCQWVWIQDGGGWWWESNCGCYRWHGPPGNHPPCPPGPPPCWWFPLPCPPPCHRPTPTPPPGRTPTPPPLCWCCLNGKVVQVSEAECRQHDGQCYPTQEEALRRCRDLCWCCINGHIVQVNTAECRERGGQCYGSREEALRHCGDLCWCCINGQVVRVPVADCRERDGQCFSNREEALRNCRPPTPTPGITGIPIGVLPTPTPQYTGVPVGVLPTPTPRYTGHTVGVKPTPTPRKYHARGTPTPPNSSSIKSTNSGRTTGVVRGKAVSTPRGKPTPTPKP